jgi:hypothetical protein
MFRRALTLRCYTVFSFQVHTVAVLRLLYESLVGRQWLDMCIEFNNIVVYMLISAVNHLYGMACPQVLCGGDSCGG